MENRNEDFLELLTKTKDSIKQIQSITKEKRNIEYSILSIKSEVKKINEFFKQFDKAINDETKKLNLYKSEINSIQFELLKKDTDKIKSIIQANLPNNIIPKEYDDKIELYRTNLVKKNNNKTINEEECIGFIEIKELETNESEVIVKIKEAYMKEPLKESFIVTNPLRIYNIIVYLNMKLNYETT